MRSAHVLFPAIIAATAAFTLGSPVLASGVISGPAHPPSLLPGKSGAAFKRPGFYPLSVIPGLRRPRLSPNQLTAQQAQASLLADQDPFWLRARQRVQHQEQIGRRGHGHHGLLFTGISGSVAGFRPVSAALIPSALPPPLPLNPLLAARDCLPGTRLLLHAMPVPGQKRIALTFDDGPHPKFTPRLLATLRQCHVPATFFLVGQMAERYPDLVREEVADGFEVANHTYHHVSLVKLPTDEALAEIEACGMVLQSVTGKPAHLFRPPGGRFTAAEAEDATQLGYTTVLWTDDPGDYTSPPESVILARVLHSARNGGILLLHDGIAPTIDVLPQLVAALRAQGYTFVTASQLAHNAPSSSHKGITPLPKKEQI